ncbi:MAG: hypothetical protein WDN45_19200 [Caulobacteraceae bacterium]
MSADPNNSRPDAGGADLARTLRAKLWVPALLMAVVVGLIWSPNLLRPPPPAWTIYTNVKGQIRRIVLADKSAVRLNGASQCAWSTRMTTAERRSVRPRPPSP